MRLDADDEGEMPSVLSMVEMSSAPATSSICRLERDVRLLDVLDISPCKTVPSWSKQQRRSGQQTGKRNSEGDAKQSSIACIHGHYGVLIWLQ